MSQDEIVSEIRKVREAYAAEFHYDVKAICCDARERQKTSRGRIVSRPPKRPASAPVAPGHRPAKALR